MTDEAPVVPFPRDIAEAPQAADWLAKLDRGDLTGDERAAFEAWLAEDPRNQSAIRNLAGFWYGLDEPLGALCVQSPARPARHAGRFARTGLSRLRWLPVAFAAAALLGTVALSFLRPGGPADETAYYSTDIGHSQQIALSDGSTITLNTNSILEQHYTKEQRTVRLVSGEAVFDVAHNPDRPFVVHAADGVIRAIGTRFAIRVGDDNVSVTVTEGRIALQQRLAERDLPGDGTGVSTFPTGADGAALLAEPIIVEQGEIGELHRTAGASKRAVSARDVNERLSWVDGELIFYDRELQAVIEEIARYTPVDIEIEDEALKARRITGVIQIGDMDMMLESIEQQLGVTVERVSPTLIHLKS